MILNERETEMAKELAREIVRVKKEKKWERFEQAFENVKGVVKEIWEEIKNTWEKGIEAIYGIKTRKNERNNWQVPLKIDMPKVPDIQLSRNINIRSQI